jgi:hypothetical protein
MRRSQLAQREFLTVKAELADALFDEIEARALPPPSPRG